MTLYAYNAWGKLVGAIEDEGDCPAGCETTTDEPPGAPYQDGHWPFYLADGWELVEVVHKLAVTR